jgi:hypothetical protein
MNLENWPAREGHSPNDAALRSDHLEPETDERPTVRPWHAAYGASVVEAVALYLERDDLFRNYPEFEPEDVKHGSNPSRAPETPADRRYGRFLRPLSFSRQVKTSVNTWRPGGTYAV